MAAEHSTGQQLSQEMMEGEQPGGAATEGPRGLRVGGSGPRWSSPRDKRLPASGRGPALLRDP